MQIIESQANRRTVRALRSAAITALAAMSIAIVSFGGATSVAAPAPSKDAKQVTASKSDKDQYTVEMRAAGTCKAGSECKVEVSLKSKGDFHINDKFPIKFKGREGQGLSYTKAVVPREEGKFAQKEGTLPIGFTSAKAGKAQVSGTFSFSVCTDANCLMEKVDLELDVDVK